MITVLQTLLLLIVCAIAFFMAMILGLILFACVYSVIHKDDEPSKEEWKINDHL